MKIKLITISREDDELAHALFSGYIKRLKHYTSFEFINLKPVKSATELVQKKADADLLLKKISEKEILILLDERGREMSSVELADFITGKMNASTQSLTFVIGGAYGFDASVYSRSNEKIALSKMTLPHQLAKVFLAEQLYRAFTILRNEKYHH
ncbi:MAG TPA: 23S rRNA (pseudouridine(1915)-N(3))-methyltransferase RlmH [Chitinophagales bacterium]|nr:23S rRNA (pseudouridine(1915)-N(3))-methyltransferase RlmH [Chitinophagales bacterium]